MLIRHDRKTLTPAAEAQKNKIYAARQKLYALHANGMTWEQAADALSGAKGAVPPDVPAKKKAVVGPEPKKAVTTPAPDIGKPFFPRPQADEMSMRTDDLTKISGVGPGTVKRLNKRGVTMYAQIAAWTKKDIDQFDKELGYRGRIARDDWVGQAKALLGDK